MSEPTTVNSEHLPRKEMLLLSLVFRPGTDYVALGDQILMDLSQVERAWAERVLGVFRPVLEQLEESQLRELLQGKIELSGDPVSQLFLPNARR